MNGHLCTPVNLSSGKEPLLPTKQETGWAPRANLDASREEEISCYVRNQTLYCHVDGLLIMRTTLSWLLMQPKFLITCGLMFL